MIDETEADYEPPIGKDSELGTVGPSGDDESFTHWAGRQIAKLGAAITNLEQGLGDHLAWCSTHTHWPPEHSFEALKDRVDGLDKADARKGDRSEQTDRALSMHNDRISQIESRLNAYGVPEARGEYRDRTRGPVIPPGDYTTVEGVRLAVTQARKESYDEGYGTGKAEALEHARRMDPLFYADVEAGVLETAIFRVKRYMGHSFSEATIGGVVQAIKGTFDGVVESIKGEPIELRRGWADLITQSQAEDVRTVLSEPAEDATVEAFHAPFGPDCVMDPPRQAFHELATPSAPRIEELPKRRPIRDNPQA